MWIVGSIELVEALWYLDGTPVTTGAATLQIWRVNTSGNKEYLQSDATTFTTTSNAFNMSLLGSSWSYNLTVPLSASEYNLQVQSTHSDSSLPPLLEEQFVSINTIDDVAGSGAGASVRP